MSEMKDIVRAELIYRGIRKPGRNVQIAKMAQEIFLEHVNKAVQTLVDVLDDEESKPGERIAAAKEILDRGLGKPVSKIDMQVNHQHEHVISAEMLENMSDDKLQEAINLLQNLMPDTIDVTPEIENESVDHATENESVKHVSEGSPPKRRNRATS
jgi:hypothetical protein